MKTRFVSLSLTGFAAIFLAGFMFAHNDAVFWVVGALALLVARDNARLPFVSGSYKLGWVAWRRTGDVREGSNEGNVVPFKGPAA